MNLPSIAELDAAAAIVYRHMPPTPQYRWPLLAERLGAEVWLKHENHTPVGAFKLRGGLVYFNSLEPVRGVVAATRGNHGQSIAFCARQYRVPATIVVPHGNSVEKNAAMRSLGARLIEHGHDFQAAKEYAESLAQTERLHMVPSFDRRLVLGVASATLELLRAVPDLELLYVPIGLGSGICAAIAERRPVEMPATTRLADGMAVRTPDRGALEIIWRHVERVVEVTDEEAARAIALIFECTHNCAEGAGAAAMAAIAKERARLAGRKVGAVLSGGNIDRDMFAQAIGS